MFRLNVVLMPVTPGVLLFPGVAASAPPALAVFESSTQPLM